MKRPNVLLLMSDQHAADIAGFAGNRTVRTPHLDRLARSAHRFEQAYCASPVCTPSRMCLLTGKEPYRCAAWGNHWVLFPEHVTWPAHFARHGYATGLVGKMHFGGRDQMHGFQSRPYGDLKHGLGHQAEPMTLFPGYNGAESAGISEIPESLNHDRVVTREALALIAEQRDRRPDQPWFVCASYTRPHSPYTAPGRFFRRYQGKLAAEALPAYSDTAEEPFARAHRQRSGTDRSTQEDHDRGLQGYYACVDFLDDCLGDLLRGLERSGALENTLIIYTSDHGDMTGRHGMFDKGIYFEPSIRVPLLIHLPGQSRGRVWQQPISLLDLFPTICRLAGLPVPRGLDGIDLSRPLRTGRGRWPRRHVGSMLCAYAAKITYVGSIPDGTPNTAFRTVRSGDWKYVAIEGGRPLLFDLKRDPGERKNLAADPARARLLKKLDRLAFAGGSWRQYQRQLRRDRRRAAKFASGKKPSTPNQYLLPDGRMFDAEASLYEARWLHLPPKLTGGIIPQQFG